MRGKTTQIYDRGYKKLFSNKVFFRQLLESFVPFEWVKELDFEHCELLDKTFISEEYEKRESDVIYKVQYQEKEIYIVILIEFQSSPDKFMALRILHYITNFYIRLKESAEKIELLPPVFPIVVYNGQEKWTAPTDIADLIENNEILGDYGLHFKYFKIAENEISVERLLDISNAVSTLFLGEVHFDVDLLARALSKLQQQEERLIVSMLFNYFEQLYFHEKLGKADWKELEKVRSEQEMSMFLESMKEHFVKVRYEGKLEGILEGKLEGILEGERKGKLEGILEGERKGKFEIAQAMLSKGLEVSFIAEITGLSVNDVEQLKNDKNH
jgi:predicted transposase/invertase (TIGR01784 family)